MGSSTVEQRKEAKVSHGEHLRDSVSLRHRCTTLKAGCFRVVANDNYKKIRREIKN